jgi:CBS domain-containing protein
MSVQNVMVKDVVTVSAGETVHAAWMRLVERDISSAPVLDDDGKLVGIVSISDIHRTILSLFKNRVVGTTMDDPATGLATAMKDATLMRVSSVLPEGQTIISIGPLDSLDRAIRMMGEKNVNLLPVLKDGAIAGVLSRQDVIWILSGKPVRRT